MKSCSDRFLLVWSNWSDRNGATGSRSYRRFDETDKTAHIREIPVAREASISGGLLLQSASAVRTLQQDGVVEGGPTGISSSPSCRTHFQSAMGRLENAARLKPSARKTDLDSQRSSTTNTSVRYLPSGSLPSWSCQSEVNM